MTKSPLDLAVEGLYRELNQHGSDLSKIPEVTRPIAPFMAKHSNDFARYIRR